jgi:tetratricopeptide (TPR) repeat protein
MRYLVWIGITLAMPILAAAQSRGIELYNEGKYAEAATALAEEVEAAPESVEKLTYLGLARVYAGDSNGGLDPLRKALARNDEYAEAHFGVGLAYFKLKNLDSSIASLERAAKLAPNHAYAQYYLGTAYNQRGKKDQAIPHLRRFVELAPNAPEAPAVRSFLSKI